MPASGISDAIVCGVTARLRTLLLAFDRQDRLETAHEFVGWLAGEASADQLESHALELLLRALRVAGDSTNFRILRELDSIDPVGIGELMRSTGLSRVAVSERVNDMVQTGLAVREMVNDQVRGTDLSAGLRELVNAAAERAGLELVEELAGRANPTTKRSGS
jgi:DNA-binding HxlR family transcriptional regulator